MGGEEERKEKEVEEKKKERIHVNKNFCYIES